jgi:poly(3-hydroxybutyrate) depolymerase
MTDPESNFRPKEESFDSDDDDLENDLSYTRLLLNHLEHNHCIDTRRVYAVGLGTGAGVVHQLACHTHLSRRIAAYAPVNGAFYRPRGENDRMWGKCLIGRRPIPMLEIHGAENGEYHLLATMDKAKSLEIVSAEEWVGDWRALNNCGANMGSPVQSIASKAVWLTQLENGQLSESTTYGGLALRSAYRCGAYKKRNNADLSKEEKDLRRITLLHYAIKGFEHGWPRMKGPERTEVFFKEQWVKPLGFPNFDASAEVLNFFRTHKLPDPDTLHGQAKALLIERGAKVYDFEKEAETQRLRMKHDEL